MRFVQVIASLAAAFSLAQPAAQAQQVTQITLQYPYAIIQKPIFDSFIERFHAGHPGIRVVTRPPYEHYEDALEKTLRGAITGDLPDISLQAINRQRVLVERKIAQPLGKFVRAEQGWEARGYSAGLMSMGHIGKDTYSLPFAVSTPVMFYNANLVRRAGGDPDKLPRDWDGILALASKINALGDDVQGVSYGWDIPGNSMWHALVFSQGGSMLTPDEAKVGFNNHIGLYSIRLLSRMAKEGGMRNLKFQAAAQSFTAGKIGLLFTSSALTEFIEKSAGERFEVRSAAFPLPAGAEKGRLPAGGNVLMVFAKKPEAQAAAWEFIKFATSAENAAYAARNTGYAPANQLAVSDPKYLGDFYRSKPNHLTNVRQLGLVTQWFSYPGDNGLKITDVITDHLQSVVIGEASPEGALKRMVDEVERLLPRK